MFPSKVCHFRYDRRFLLVEKWGTLERAGRYVWKNSFNLVCQYSIRSGIFQVAYK